MSEKPAARVLAAIEATPWLIQPEALEQIRAIAAREHEISPEAISRYAESDGGNGLEIVGNTAVVSLSGSIFQRANLFSAVSGAATHEQFARSFVAAETSDADHIVIRVDSPGGVVPGTSENAALVRSASKPVTAYVSGMGASAAYWILSAADNVVIEQTALVGSIGVKTREPEAADASDMVSRGAPRKLGTRASAQRIIDEIESVFVESVAENRGVSVEHVRDQFGQGDLLLGREAVLAGMADAIGTLDVVLQGAIPAKRIRGEAPPPQTRSYQMGEQKKDGENEAQTAALAAARQEAKLEAEKATATAVTAERQRVGAILEAGVSKPAEQVRTLIDEGVSAETAVKILAATPDVTTSKLSAVMAGQNPSLASDNGDIIDEEARELAEAEAGWDKAFGRGAAA